MDKRLGGQCEWQGDGGCEAQSTRLVKKGLDPEGQALCEAHEKAFWLNEDRINKEFMERGGLASAVV